MNSNRALFAVVAALSFGHLAHAQLFTFDANAQGWKIFNISEWGQDLTSASPISDAPWQAGTGLPGGNLRVNDLTAETWIGETNAVRGNKSDLYGIGEFSFDIYYRTRDEADYAAVAIRGGGLTLVQSHVRPPLNTWLHWSFPLAAGTWRINDSRISAVATEAQVRAVLADFTGAFIQTEWTTGPDDTSVDNILIGIEAPPCNCPADFDQSGGTPDSTDIDAFFSAWLQGEPNADADCSGGTPDITDIDAFFTAWLAGGC